VPIVSVSYGTTCEIQPLALLWSIYLPASERLCAGTGSPSTLFCAWRASHSTLPPRVLL
ncbi:unnamed protein product, partial [Ectocarpus sp. 12 AP-2014]